MTNELTTHDTGHDAGRDDPRLTAYALGELDGQEHAAARAEIEALLATDAKARDEVARIRELADKHLNPSMIWLVVGDAKTQMPRLQALDLGTTVRLDRDGTVLH